MRQADAKAMIKQLKKTMSETQLNELGRLTRLCKRERIVRPGRLPLALISALANRAIMHHILRSR